MAALQGGSAWRGEGTQGACRLRQSRRRSRDIDCMSALGTYARSHQGCALTHTTVRHHRAHLSPATMPAGMILPVRVKRCHMTQASAALITAVLQAMAAGSGVGAAALFVHDEAVWNDPTYKMQPPALPAHPRTHPARRRSQAGTAGPCGRPAAKRRCRWTARPPTPGRRLRRGSGGTRSWLMLKSTLVGPL